MRADHSSTILASSLLRGRDGGYLFHIVRLLNSLADRIADRLAIALEPRLRALEVALESRVLRQGKKAAASILARKTIESALEPQAVQLDPPNGDSPPRRTSWRNPWDSR